MLFFFCVHQPYEWKSLRAGLRKIFSATCPRPQSSLWTILMLPNWSISKRHPSGSPSCRSLLRPHFGTSSAASSIVLEFSPSFFADNAIWPVTSWPWSSSACNWSAILRGFCFLFFLLECPPLTVDGSRFNLALDDQPYFVEAASPLNQGFCLLLFVIGTTLVLSSFWVLGITGRCSRA